MNHYDATRASYVVGCHVDEVTDLEYADGAPDGELEGAVVTIARRVHRDGIAVVISERRRIVAGGWARVGEPIEALVVEAEEAVAEEPEPEPELADLTVAELRALADELGVEVAAKAVKADLIAAVEAAQAAAAEVAEGDAGTEPATEGDATEGTEPATEEQ